MTRKRKIKKGEKKYEFSFRLPYSYFQVTSRQAVYQVLTVLSYKNKLNVYNCRNISKIQKFLLSIKVILLLLRIERRIERKGGFEEESYYYVLQMKLIKCN